MDVDPPLIVDDEHWETGNPESAFKQPHGKPSYTEAFGLWLTLTKISAFAVRTLVGGPAFLRATSRRSNPPRSMRLTSPRWHLLEPRHLNGGNGRLRSSMPQCPSGLIHCLITVWNFPWPPPFTLGDHI